jgi:hypothetical protein
VREWDGGHEGRFRLGEGGVRIRRPKELFGAAPEEVCERFQDASNGREEPAIKIYQAEKPLELPQVSGAREAGNSFHMTRERDDSTLTHHMPQKLDGGDCKGALGRVNGEAIIPQDFEKYPQMFQVFLHCCTSDQVIV